MKNPQSKCFISLLIKAVEIKKKFKLYTSEKEYAKIGNADNELNKCLGTKFSESFNTILNAPKNVKPGFFNRFLVEDSVENFIFKSVMGFLGGILLTYIFFMFLVFSLNFTLKRATYICIGLGIILSLGLAFSVKIRCTVFLCIPQLFSKRGRQALLAYAFILALSGPAKNTLHNVEVMSESLACTQEQLKQAENELLKCVQKPNAAAKKTIEKLLEKMNSAVKDFKNFILQLYKTCFDILETVLHAQKWLYSISLLCHKKMGKPAHRCLNLLTETTENCEQMSSEATWKQLCSIHPYGQELICSTNAKSFCLECDIPPRIPVSKLQKQLIGFKHRAMNILYVNIEAHQTFSPTNRSCTYHEEYQGMATEIRQKTDQFLQYFDFMSVIFGIFILVLFVKVIIYRHKFLTEDHYDNRYITSDFVDIDNTRAAFRMETLLPLAPREKLQYIKVTSVRLVPCERVRLLSSFVFLIFATFKIIIHMLTDSSLYWILSTVRRNERLLYMSTLKEEEPIITVRVVGRGLVAELFRNVSRVVKRESAMVRLDPTPCLPDPVPPDWNRYYQILALVLICWLLAVCEPYGLRLRHSVMVTYHPDRARERAIWLYNRIISNRISFVKLSRRELRKKYKDVWLEDTFRYKFMRKASSPRCLLCKTSVGGVDSRVKCSTSNCAGLYCTACFSCLKFCSICRDPAEYGDLSDLSEEKDSSEEECPNRSLKRKKGNQAQGNIKSKKKKGEISLNLKKANITYRKNEKRKMAEKTKSDSLLQPTLFYRALKYCRSKMPSFRKLKTLSDFESSDWDHDSTTIPEGSSFEDYESSEQNMSVGEKKSALIRCPLSIRKSRGRIKTSGVGGSSPKSISPIKSEKNVQVCLFQKVQPEAGASTLPKSNKSREPPQPDFFFRVSKKVGDAPEMISTRFMNTLEGLNVCKDKEKVMGDIFSERCRESGPKTLASDLSTGSIDPQEREFDARFFTQTLNPSTQIIADPLELDVEYSELKKDTPRKLPFIDPINIHEFDLGTNSNEEIFQDGCASDLGSGENSESEGESPRPCTVPYRQSRARVCFGSLDTVPSQVKLCAKTYDNYSSSESDCQYYYRPFRSPKTYKGSVKKSGDLKKAAAKINIKMNKFSDSYSVETDSSNEKFLSVKPQRRVNKNLIK